MGKTLAKSNGRPGRLFVITGIDGAGKSTLLARLGQLLPHATVGSYAPRRWINGKTHPQLRWMLEADPRPIVGRMPAKARASFLHHMVLTHWESWLQPRLDRGVDVLMDSLYFRFWAREEAWGGEPAIVASLARYLPRPDCSIFLDLEPELAAMRKETFDPNETGWVTSCDSQHGAFLQHQKKLIPKIREACICWSQKVAIVYSAQPPAQVTAEAANALGLARGEAV